VLPCINVTDVIPATNLSDRSQKRLDAEHMLDAVNEAKQQANHLMDSRLAELKHTLLAKLHMTESEVKSARPKAR
jgi:hypothetical protein